MLALMAAGDSGRMFLTKHQALAEFPGLGRRALERAASAGELDVYRFDGWPRFSRGDLEAWIARRRARPERR